MQSQVPKLVVFTKGKPREIEMGQELTIGRGYSNLLRLEGEEISRVHAIIYRRNNDFILRDLDSKNGVFLNGNKIAYAQLGPGDRLQVGKYRMIFDPPANADFQEYADRNFKESPEEHPENLQPSPDDSEHTSSRRMAVDVVPSPPRTAPPLPPARSREEIYILNRSEQDTQVAAATDQESQVLNDLFMKSFTASTRRTDNSESLADVILQALVKTVAADRAVIVLKEPESDNLSPVAMVAGASDVAVNRVVLRSGLSEAKAMLCPRTEECGLFRDSQTVIRDKISTLISVPLGKDEPFGILYLDRQGEDAEEFALSHLYSAIQIARLLELHLADRNHKSARGEAN